MAVLYDPNRDIVGTSLLALETVGHASFNNRSLELEFYRKFFESIVTEQTDVNEGLVAEAMLVSKATDAHGIDALHIAAAVKLGAHEFITSEKATKPMFRETRLKVRHLDDL